MTDKECLGIDCAWMTDKDKTDLIESLTTKLNFTTRQYEALQKKYVEVLQTNRKMEQDYESCLRNLKNEIEELKLFRQ